MHKRLIKYNQDKVQNGEKNHVVGYDETVRVSLVSIGMKKIQMLLNTA